MSFRPTRSKQAMSDSSAAQPMVMLDEGAATFSDGVADDSKGDENGP